MTQDDIDLNPYVPAMVATMKCLGLELEPAKRRELCRVLKHAYDAIDK